MATAHGEPEHIAGRCQQYRPRRDLNVRNNQPITAPVSHQNTRTTASASAAFVYRRFPTTPPTSPVACLIFCILHMPVLPGVVRCVSQSSVFDEAQARAWLTQGGKPPAASDMAVRIEAGGAGIGDYIPVCPLAIKNIGKIDFERCLVEMIEFSGTLPPNVALPLTLRAANQIRGNERGRLLLSAGQETIIPLVFHRPQRANEWFFVEIPAVGTFSAPIPPR